MPVSHSQASRGFTLIEIVLSVALLGILATISFQLLSGTNHALKYEETRQKMEAIRKAILGDDSLDSRGNKTSFGYFGDMGMLPATLTSLTTQGSQALWTFDPTFSVGAGWRGPYYLDKFTNSSPVDKDAWGNALSWATSGTPTLTSFGSDGAAGSTSDPYSKDLTMTFPNQVRFATIRGFVRDNDVRIPNTEVEIKYPSAGVITSYRTLSTSDGSFTFNTVPFSIAAISLRSAPVLGTFLYGLRQVAVGVPQVVIPPESLNLNGAKLRVTTSGNASTATDASNQHVDISINSGYETALNIDYFTINWSGGPTAFLEFIKVGTAAAQNLSGLGGTNCAPSRRVVGQIPAGQQFAANSTGTTLRLSFSSASDCSGVPAATMSGALIHIEFQWKETKSRDAISFTVP